MADISVFKISRGTNDSKATSGITAGAASQTVPQSGKDQRLALRVVNSNAAHEAVVRITPGSGPRAALGSMSVTVAAMNTTYIPLFDSARFKNLSTGDITVELVDSAGVALEGAELANVQIEAVQM